VDFRTGVKGWDILKKMRVPNPWTIVLNSNSASDYGLDDKKISLRLQEKKAKKTDYDGDHDADDNDDGSDNLISLQKGFLPTNSYRFCTMQLML
jgi:hypothetical protein